MNVVTLKQKMKEDSRGVFGALFMAVFAALSFYRWTATGSLFFILLLFRDIIFAGFFLSRSKLTTGSSLADEMLSYISTALPLFYSAFGVEVSSALALIASMLAILGFFIATLAVIELGNRVGVSPAKRGTRCKTGVYKWIRHPMYTGYMIAEISWVILSPKNVILFSVSSILYLYRMKLEDRVLRTTAN